MSHGVDHHTALEMSVLTMSIAMTFRITLNPLPWEPLTWPWVESHRTLVYKKGYVKQPTHFKDQDGQ